MIWNAAVGRLSGIARLKEGISKMQDDRFMGLCEALDALVNIDFMQRGNIMGQLYEAARQHHGAPLTSVAAKAIVERVPRDSAIVITGGNIVLPTYLGIGETDGPGGVAVLARAMTLGLNTTPVVYTEAGLVTGMTEVMAAAGFAVVNLDQLKRYRGDGFALSRGEFVATVLAFPEDPDDAQAVSDQILTDLDIKAAIATEKIGRNSEGIYHSSLGTDMSQGMGMLDVLFEEAMRRGILTIGIGDGGNEIGYGLIEDTVRQHKLYGDMCRCPCGRGIATTAKTDVLITTEVSNWGCSALSAALLSLLDMPNSVHGPSLEHRVLEATARAGFIHLATEVSTSVDSFDMDVGLAIVQLIRDLARKAESDIFTSLMTVSESANISD